MNKIKNVAKLIRKSKSILFITGAGISADSGLPTYRGIGGLYNNELTEDGISVEMALSIDVFNTNPEITWKYLSQIEKNCRNAAFNRGHEIIAEIGKKIDRVWVLTQNVDGFHKMAGSKNIIDIHGDLHNLLCTKCRWSDEVKDYSCLEIPPRCPLCKNIVRPEVVLFGEQLPLFKVSNLHEELDTGFDLYFSIGTTSTFDYISDPIRQAKNYGKPTVEINPSATSVSGIVDIKISLGAAEALDKIWDEVN